MPRKTKKLPDDVVKHWPEVFTDVELNVVPIKYLHSVRVQFGDGKIWDIDVGKSKLKDSPEAVEKSLSDLFAEYENSIKHIDFRLDTQKIKHDIQKRTASFLKKRR